MQVYYLQDLEITEHAWGHMARSWVEEEREGRGERVHFWDSAFSGEEGRVLGFWKFTLDW